MRAIECHVYVGWLFITDVKTAELIQPRKGALHTTQRQPPTRYHAACCALQAEAVCAGHVWRDECFPHRKPGHPARSQRDSAAFHGALEQYDGFARSRT